MRVMAVDYGDVRTGVAVSDATQTLAGDAWVIQSKNMKETARALVDEASRRDVSCIVVGYPKNMDGSVGERAKKSEALAETLKAAYSANAESASPHIKLWDERLTTKSAIRILSDAGKRGKKQKQKVDAVAASLILESYLASK